MTLPLKARTIGVLLGGDSSEREISIRSGKAVSAALRSLGYRVTEIGETSDLRQTLETVRIDIAFVALHGRFGEDGQVQALLEKRGIPYTGSGPDASSLAFDKIKAKEIWTAGGILTPKHEVVRQADYKSPWQTELEFPVVVKPVSEGSSIGFSRVDVPARLDEAIRLALRYGEAALIERFIGGPEVTAGILCEEALPLVQVRPKDGCYDFQHKYTKGMTEYLVPAPVDEKLAARIRKIALEAHRALGCRDFSRSDFIIGPDGKPYLLEINTIPGMTETSLLPKAAAAAGVDFAAMCEKVLLSAAGRAGRVQ